MFAEFHSLGPMANLVLLSGAGALAGVPEAGSSFPFLLPSLIQALCLLEISSEQAKDVWLLLGRSPPSFQRLLRGVFKSESSWL